MRTHYKNCQSGAILLIAMVVLVAMTLSALALVKSVNTTNLIAGNLGFRESALLSSERSTERAVKFLQNKASNNYLHTSHMDEADQCYSAVRIDPTDSKGWDELIGKNNKCGSRDAAGNNVWYVIHRLCEATGYPYGKPDKTYCSKSPRGNNDSSQQTGPNTDSSGTPQIYYRITTRVKGPRNTAVYTQTIIAM
jgi:Tfp pilus assembly protein PilX